MYVPLHADTVHHAEVTSRMRAMAVDIKEATSDGANPQLNSERHQVSPSSQMG
jgi:hypothetical protein